MSLRTCAADAQNREDEQEGDAPENTGFNRLVVRHQVSSVEGRFSAGDAARYVMENSAEKLGDAILEMLDDPQRREQMGRLGYERLTRELSWEKSVEQLLATYERAVRP